MAAEDKKVMDQKIEEGERKERKQKKNAAIAKMKKESTGFVSDFKKFITKGNVLDLAVAVVIGGAFGKITSGLVNFLITPLTSLFLGDVDLTGLKTVLVEANEAEEIAEVALQWGAWLQTIIDFLIIALCIFVVVRIVKGAERRLNAKEIAAKEAEEAAKKAEADAKAAAEAEKAAALAAREEEFYANVREQNELLRQIAQSLKK